MSRMVWLQRTAARLTRLAILPLSFSAHSLALQYCPPLGLVATKDMYTNTLSGTMESPFPPLSLSLDFQPTRVFPSFLFVSAHCTLTRVRRNAKPCSLELTYAFYLRFIG